MDNFNSHASCEAWRFYEWYNKNLIKISTHTPHARRDSEVTGRALHVSISTHTPHARRDHNHLIICGVNFISTHTPHARRDKERDLTERHYEKISTHTPHARRDVKLINQQKKTSHFNSHASCEAWPHQHHKHYGKWYFNSHASCEAWHHSEILWMNGTSFQLTRLMRGVTKQKYYTVEMDCDFNSHASCEAWPYSSLYNCNAKTFQLTRLMRGVTKYSSLKLRLRKFQLTRLMRGVTLI